MLGTGFLLITAVLLRFALGIVTLVLAVPAALGVAHQAGAMILLTVVVIALSRNLPSLAPDPRLTS